jgi:hypothetical protein
MYGNAEKDLDDNIFVQKVPSFFQDVIFWCDLSS